MFGISNPYHGVVQALDEAISACYRAISEMQGIPRGKGRGEFESTVYYAKQTLEGALASASRWQDSYDYHLHGGGGHVRSDF